ncbi:EAL and HDOD domain-containing protein [Billgrantia endophytica]|uniref:Intracellular signaling protein n=1 Tax=Billgrantia endophytica TaxID=2033802 RepID=A0A2N7U105_9GAMM|nr:HDOD domain-containing protein [Halomonas endophytica]PMR74114.1 intracellular signaling protein [Halomonas endophytica]
MMRGNESTLLASQPIFDRGQRIRGVELLYRNDRQQGALEVGEYRATTELLYNLCAGITQQMEHFRAPAFINVSADFLLSRAFLPVPPEKVVIELVERIEPTAEILDCIGHWHRQGFRFALDDYQFSPHWAPLLPFASIIKVDISTTSVERAMRQRATLQHLDVMWLAERIENENERDAYVEAGFDLFQGYYFARPTLIHGQKPTPSSLRSARLIGTLYQPEPDMAHISRIISNDPELSCKLVRIANSPFYQGAGTIGSIREAIARLGLDNLKRWVILLGLLETSRLEHANLVLTRAKACELLAERQHGSARQAEEGYLAGLLSGTDLLLGIEPADFLQHMGVSDAIRMGVLHETGPLGTILHLVKRVERRIVLKEELAALNPTLLGIYQEATNAAAAIMAHTL